MTKPGKLTEPSQLTNAQKVQKTSGLKGYTIPKITQRTDTEHSPSAHREDLTELGQQITQLVADARCH